MFMGHWIVPHGVLDYMLTYNESKFTSRFLDSLCPFLGTKHLKKSSYRPQTYEQAENAMRRLYRDYGTKWGNTNQTGTFCAAIYIPV